jgi:hypothetical protein
VDIDFIDLVIAGLQQDRHVQLGTVDQFGDCDLIAKVWQANYQSVDLVAVRLEMRGIKLSIRNALHRAIRRGLKWQDDGFDPQSGEMSQNLGTCGLAGRRAKKGPTADNQPQRHLATNC